MQPDDDTGPAGHDVRSAAVARIEAVIGIMDLDPHPGVRFVAEKHILGSREKRIIKPHVTLPGKLTSFRIHIIFK